MSRTTISAVLVVLLLAAPAIAADDDDAAKVDELQAKRSGIDGMARESLERLFENDPATPGLFDESFGYAVFDNLKVAVLISGGGGVGVAVKRASGEKTYMKMGTGGIGLGLGGQSYQVVFFFETEETFDRFVQKGWQAQAGATAAAGTSGVNAPSTFSNGVAIFQMTHKGLLANADIAGTKYWKYKKLNR